MGLAKYWEDDLEIMDERRQRMQARQEERGWIEYRPARAIPREKTGRDPGQTDTGRGPGAGKPGEGSYLICRDCGKRFLFSTRSQSFFKEKGWQAPKRCKACREIRKKNQSIRNSDEGGAKK